MLHDQVIVSHHGYMMIETIWKYFKIYEGQNLEK